jgi:hypothetical protein
VTRIRFDRPLSHRTRIVAVSWYTCDEAAAALGRAPRTVREWVLTGRLRRTRRTANRHGREVLLVASCCVAAELETALCECRGTV